MAWRPLLSVPIAFMALFAGCITHSEGTGPSDPLEAFSDADGMITRPDGNVVLTASMPADPTPGQNASWQLQVVHHGQDGDPPFPYSSICHSPWQVALRDEAGASVALHEGQVECLAYGTAYLGPGDELGTTWTWNLTWWDARGDSYQPLGAGAYTLEFRFERQDPDGGRAGGPTAEQRFVVS